MNSLAHSLALVCSTPTLEALAMFCHEAPAVADGAIMYMPAGTHTIRPSQGGKPVTVSVLVEPRAAVELDRQRAALLAAGRRPFFDLNHKDGEASFWPEQFFWQDGARPGVYARGEWSSAGKQAIEGKLFRQFSPVFFVNDVKAKPARVICNAGATPNMGGLVNNPAFKEIAPLWSHDAGTVQGADPGEISALTRRVKAITQEARQLLR